MEILMSSSVNVVAGAVARIQNDTMVTEATWFIAHIIILQCACAKAYEKLILKSFELN